MKRMGSKPFEFLKNKIRELLSVSQLTMLSTILFTLLVFFYIYKAISQKDFNSQLTGLTIISILIGYLLVHLLEMERTYKSKKLELYLELTRGLRFLILEQQISKEKKVELRDKLQDAYLSASLFIPKESYKMFTELINLLSQLNTLENKELKEDLLNKFSS